MRTPQTLLLLFALLPACGGGGGTPMAQPDMTQLLPTPDMSILPLAPTWTAFASRGDDSRWGLPLAYSSKDKKFIGFAGSQFPAANNGGTYSLDMTSGQWTKLADSKEPMPTYCSCTAWLPDQNQVIVFAGLGDNGPLANGAWTLDLATGAWSALAAPMPTGGIGCAITYMPKLGKAIVFGGLSVKGFNNETWAYDPAQRTFTKLTPASAPRPRADMISAYDPGDGGRMLLFAGTADEQTDKNHYSDLWAFDGTNWSEIKPAGGPPPPRRVPAGGFDPVRRRWVVFGGTVETMDLGDLWVFDVGMNTWTELPAVGAPDARGFPSAGYDPGTDSYFVIGGLQQPDDNPLADGWKLTLP